MNQGIKTVAAAVLIQEQIEQNHSAVKNAWNPAVHLHCTSTCPQQLAACQDLKCILIISRVNLQDSINMFASALARVTVINVVSKCGLYCCKIYQLYLQKLLHYMHVLNLKGC